MHKRGDYWAFLKRHVIFHYLSFLWGAEMKPRVALYTGFFVRFYFWVCLKFSTIKCLCSSHGGGEEDSETSTKEVSFL